MMFRIRYIAVLLALSGAIFSLPSSSFADNAESANLTVYTPQPFKCIVDEPENSGDPKPYTQSIIKCIETPIRAAVLKGNDGLLAITTKHMGSIVTAAITLAIVWFGVRVTMGENNLFPRAMSLMIRIGFVTVVLSQSIKYGGDIYMMFDQVILIAVPEGFTPWKAIDAFFGKLLGFSEDGGVKDGIIALLNGSFFSKNLGAMLTIAGSFSILSILLLVFQTIYLYLVSVVAIGFLIIISPFVIVAFIFTYTETYFIRWFNLLLSNIIAPMMMFAFLSMFIIDTPAIPASESNPGRAEKKAIITELVDKIFDTLGPDYVRRCLHVKQPLFPSMITPTTADQYNYLYCLGQPIGCPTPPDISALSTTQSYVSPFLSYSFNYSGAYVPKFDCHGKSSDGDAKTSKEMQDTLLLCFLELFLFTVLMNSALSLIPTISSGIAGGATASATDLMTPLTRAMKTFRK